MPLIEGKDIVFIKIYETMIRNGVDKKIARMLARLAVDTVPREESK